ncbi:MAG: chemotaxis protein CheB [Alphaproteobacteria bacterium]|nr:chemotaxis protein CheB [Alphaproteobacteria bacterium]
MARIVAIGASQGGVEALHALVSGLDKGFPAPILVVMHIGAGPSILPVLLNDLGILPASHARDGERIEPGHIYVAPADHHLLVNDGALELTRGPRENWTRPAIDPLFRSLAESHRQDAIGVILTGGLNDGTAGLYEIKRRGGIAIVQDPADAEARSMPQSAAENVDVDFCVPLRELPGLLTRLAREPSIQRATHETGVSAMAHSNQEMQHPIAQTCPECGGAMREEVLGKLTQFRCHIGHVMTAQVLAAAQLEILEYDLSAVLRMLNERVELCNDIANKHGGRGNGAAEAEWRQAADEAKSREAAIRQMTEAEWRRPEAMSPAE